MHRFFSLFLYSNNLKSCFLRESWSSQWPLPISHVWNLMLREDKSRCIKAWRCLVFSSVTKNAHLLNQTHSDIYMLFSWMDWGKSMYVCTNVEGETHLESSTAFCPFTDHLDLFIYIHWVKPGRQKCPSINYSTSITPIWDNKGTKNIVYGESRIRLL